MKNIGAPTTGIIKNIVLAENHADVLEGGWCFVVGVLGSSSCGEKMDSMAC